MNIGEIYVQLTELVQAPFDPAEFPFRLLEFYNAPKATLTKLRTGAQNKGEQAGDVLWSRKLFFRPAPQGQTAATLDALKEAKATKTHKPRFLLATDGTEVAAYDVKADDPLHIDYAKLNDRFDFFLPLAGIEKYEAVAESPADIKAAGRLAKLHDEIERCNPDWLAPDKRHALNQFLTRVLFCMFAQSTGSFSANLFVKTVSEFGGIDGENLQSLLKKVFDVMNVPEDCRQGLPVHICAFPYVNGGLFADSAEVPAFNRRAKRMLVEAAQLDWKEINPDIFGSMIQAVVDTDMRGDLGMHYTSVPNIMKVLQPLFLMSLEEEFERARGHREERSLLRKLLTRISKLRVFDPACGSGNFLIIAYRELRKLEMRVFQRLDEISGGTTTWREQSGVRLSNFYGIELADFAAETAKLSLWIAEYQMNQKFKTLFGEAPQSFPLKEGGHIVCGNALRRDWLDVCPPPTKTVQKEKVFDLSRIEKAHAMETVPDDEVETYIVGNPQFEGAREQSKAQKSDMRFCMDRYDGVNSLDYVCCWLEKAAQYATKNRSAIGYVATSSICQGQSVPLFWKAFLSHNIEIHFAYRPFLWRNNAKQNAAVTCVIVGLREPLKAPKYIFDDASRKQVSNISPYLTDNEDVFIEKRMTPIDGRAELVSGNQSIDGGYLILTGAERTKLISSSPEAERFLRPLYGANDFVQGTPRSCIWVRDTEEQDACKIPALAERFQNVKEYRENGGEVARSLTQIPYRFRYVHEARESMLLVPRHTTERRDYIPIGLLDSTAIVTDGIQVIYDAEVYWFSVLSSRMHMCWIKAVAGRIKTDPRYSNTLVYNNFPLPTFSAEGKTCLEDHAWSIISARDAHPGKTLDWLYDPKTMPGNLVDAHKALDEALEKIYIGRPFKNDTERLEHLFKLYREMTAGRHREAVDA
ncbi:putative DNA methyltransferase yeeA [Hyphomicrobium sp. GJ21]|uniref:class I SAM-dependent DNA methyltransferase n=1 Tax=Hyphomicrobium sp. GJ21 TaxID=113574 RepID=UPI000622B8F2|nr:DNA methyltransferase [Hyphomicrobium sp. GJ21]CEJ84448.1 putative DNA methyltransferase yeeA [Hyphomicrobium sp. GJ21]